MELPAFIVSPGEVLKSLLKLLGVQIISKQIFKRVFIWPM